MNSPAPGIYLCGHSADPFTRMGREIKSLKLNNEGTYTVHVVNELFPTTSALKNSVFPH